MALSHDACTGGDGAMSNHYLKMVVDDGELSNVRSDTVAIYQDGDQVGEFCNPTLQKFEDADDVREKGIEFISFYMDRRWTDA